MSVFLRKYATGSGSDVIIPMIKRGVVDFAATGDWTPATGDVKVSIDGGAEANIGTLPVINGTYGWKFVFSNAELTGKSIRVTVVDSATKAVEDQMFLIETFGNASAMYPIDWSIAPGAAGGLMIAGSNAATTFATLTVTGAFTVNGGVTYTNASGSGFICSSTGGNGSGMFVSGNGSGDGAQFAAGATANGIHCQGGATSGEGFRAQAVAGNSAGFLATGNGTGAGLEGDGGLTGPGIYGLGGLTSGSGIKGTGQAGNSHGIAGNGQGTGDGMHLTGGATGDGLEAVGGSSSGDGFKGTVTSGTAFRGNLIGNITGDITGSLSGSVGSVTTVSAGAITSTSFAAGAIDASAIAADAIGASELAATAVAEIAAGVWDLATAGHTTSGTFGAAMAAAGAAGDPWSTSLPGAYGNGTAGFIVGTNIDALISSRTKPADTQAAVTLVTTTTNLTNSPTAGDLTATMKASVKTQITDALAVDTYAEPVSVPAATSTLKDKLNWIFSLMRNKRTQTATLETLRNDTDGANIATSTKSDDGTTLTRGEWA